MFWFSPRFDLVEQNIRSYLVKRLLPLAKSDLRSCQVTVPLPGKNTTIRIVRAKNGQGFVVRIFPPQGRKKMKAQLAAHESLRAKGVNVPEIVDHVERYSRSHLAILTERLIEGHTLRERSLDPATIEQLARLLIPLHRAKSPLWGAGRWRRGGFASYSLGHVRNRLRAVRKDTTRAIDGATLRRIRDWFIAESHALAALSQFDLTHDKINPGNILWAEQEKQYYLLDLATVCYAAKAKDLVALYHEALGDDPQLIARFEDHYCAAFPEQENKQNISLWRWYHAYYHLAEAATRTRRSHRATSHDAAYELALHEKFLRHWQQLLALINAERGRLEDEDRRMNDEL